MKFKIKKVEKAKHTELVACVGWSNMNELFRLVISSFIFNFMFISVGDDQAIWKWDINGEAVSISFITLKFK